MKSWGIVDDTQLSALAKLLEEYSREIGIDGDQEARELLGTNIMSLFTRGIRKPEDIRRHLDSNWSRLMLAQAALLQWRNPAANASRPPAGHSRARCP
jgi:hypothetical protein